MRARLAIVACLVAGGVAAAQPAPDGDKTDARALMQSGLKLFGAQDYLGALAVFKDAYARFPSAKILLNIGTTLTRLDRKADAANVYQRYLDSSDADPKRRPEVTKALDDLDRAVGILELEVTPATAEVQVGDGEWVVASTATHLRVTPGEATIHVRADRYEQAAKWVRAAAGGKLAIVIALTATATAPVTTTTTTATGTTVPVQPRDDAKVVAVVVPEPGRSRFGMVALAHVDVVHPGGAALVGVTADLTSRLQVQATALVGKKAGGYAGASFALLPGRFRPILVAGVPIFVSSGARVSVRGAGGLEVALNRHLALIAEVGVEHVFNPEPNVAATLFVPAIGAVGRL
jgi:hypothetical protein